MEKTGPNVLNFPPLESWTDYKLLEHIGTGAYSTVWEAQYVPTGSKVAIKIEEAALDDIVKCKRILREIKLLRKLRHPNVVRLIDVFMSTKDNARVEVYVVMELIDTDVRQLLKSSSLSEKQIKTIFYNTLLAINYLQSAEVMHRDVKPANILVTKRCHAKLCDFGLARTVFEESPMVKAGSDEGVKTPLARLEASGESSSALELYFSGQLPERSRRLTMHVVTRWYRAPELILMQEDYGHKVDMWALGCLFAELQGTKKENGAGSKERSPLFPGKTRQPALLNECGLTEENNGQLSAIFDVIGSPEPEDCEFIADKELAAKLQKLPKKHKKNFEEMYPGSEKLAIDLLNSLLQFNPNRRISIDKCMEHPYLASVRAKEREIPASHKIVLEFPADESLDGATIKKMFIEEVEYFEKLKKTGKLFAE